MMATFLLTLWLLSITTDAALFNNASFTILDSGAKNGATLSIENQNDVKVNNSTNNWDVEVTDQQGWHFRLDLDSTWGFHPTKISNIIFSMDGISRGTDQDWIISFSVGSSVYFSTVVTLDIVTPTKGGNYIVPLCAVDIPSTDTLLVGDVYSAVNDINTTMAEEWNQRVFEVGFPVKNMAGWNMEPNNIVADKSAQYPIIYRLENDPINDILKMTFTNPLWESQDFRQTCYYKAFPVNTGLNIFIAGDDPQEKYTVSLFDIKYYFGSDNGTFSPTGLPSKNPSVSPTENPSVSPTKNPSTNPTRSSTVLTSENPSSNPTRTPTVLTSEIPTFYPTWNPTQSSNHPTNIPTTRQMSTLAPTITLYNGDSITIYINVTVKDEILNVNLDDIITTVNVSVEKYLNQLDADVEYKLILEIIGDKNSSRLVTFRLMIANNTHIKIDHTDLRHVIQQDLETEYGIDKVTVVTGDTTLTNESPQEQKNYFQEITLAAIIIFVFIIMISYIYAKCIRINDFYRLGSLISAGFHIFDNLSDVFFALQITYNPSFGSSQLLFIFILSAACIILPTLVTLLQLYHTSNKHWNKNDVIRAWMAEYIFILYLTSIVCGSSFAAVHLCRSNMFGMPLFDIPLTKKDALEFETNKIYSTVLLENAPQLMLAVWYIQILGKTPQTIVYITMIFSLISIITTVISMCTTKKLMNTQNYYSIIFDVDSTQIARHVKKCRNNVRNIRYEIAVILGLHESLVEITRPKLIPNALQISVNIYINHAKSIDLNCEKKIINANNCGQLPSALKRAWRLSTVPIIANIKYEQHASQQRDQNVVKIQVQSQKSIMLTNVDKKPPLSSIIVLPPKIPHVVMTDYGDNHAIFTEDSPREENYGLENYDLENPNRRVPIGSEGNDKMENEVMKRVQSISYQSEGVSNHSDDELFVDEENIVNEIDSYFETNKKQ